MWRHEIKEQTLQLTLLYCGRTVKNTHQRYSIKKAVLKNLQYRQETPGLDFLFKNVRPTTLLKRDPSKGVFL